MTIDLTRDDLIHISQVAKQFPGPSGKPRSLRSVHRWIQEGVRGVKLEAAPAGSSWYTTREAIEEFSRRLAESRTKEPASQPPRSNPRHEAAMAKLRARGMVKSPKKSKATP